ncbi:MAG: hypothetical protein VB099_15425 [Candidatus Limiplasma sp.]|nr:hypothetical protein [Candidatus Limiplasma sp.]
MEDYHNQMITKIRTAIEREILTFSRLDRILRDIIYKELSKTNEPADLALVESAQAFLIELYGGYENVSDEMMRSNLEGVRRKLNRRIHRVKESS